MARLAMTGVLLFAFIPLVLFLYLRQPLGPGLSILAGLVIMFGHRFVASPWMIRHARERCLWCGRGVGGDDGAVETPRGKGVRTPNAKIGTVTLTVQAGGRPVALAACSSAHADHTARFLTFVYRRRTLIGLGIFVPLAILLGGSLALAAGHPLLPHYWNTWQFRAIVAFTVVATSLAWHGVAHAADPLRSPFPLHNLFLLGIRNTLWVFRSVGAWWLAGGVLEIFGGLGA